MLSFKIYLKEGAMSTETSKNKVVIVGGGVAGSLLARSIQNYAKVTLIDPKEYFEIPWANLRSKVDPAFAEKTLFNHSEYLANGNIIISAATNITEKEVITEDNHHVEYDYLVIATGHVPSNLRSRKDRLEQFQEEYMKIKNSGSILIIGGGPAGVELAGEIAVDFPEKKVTIVHNGTRLLEFIGHRAANKTLEWLQSKKVEVLLGQSVNLESISEADKMFTTSTGEIITADCYFVCIDKLLGSSWLHESFLKERINRNGRLMVDDNLRVAGYKNIFAIGDITDIPELKQGFLAQRHAMVVMRNIKLLLKGSKENKLAKYRAASSMAMVSLGRNNAVAQVPFFSVIGSIPGKIKSKDLFVTKTRKMMGIDPHPKT